MSAVYSALLALCAGNSPVPVNSPHNGQWRRALMLSLICVWINDWVNNHEAGDLRRHRGHYDVNVMWRWFIVCKLYKSLWFLIRTKHTSSWLFWPSSWQIGATPITITMLTRKWLYIVSHKAYYAYPIWCFVIIWQGSRGRYFVGIFVLSLRQSSYWNILGSPVRKLNSLSPDSITNMVYREINESTTWVRYYCITCHTRFIIETYSTPSYLSVDWTLIEVVMAFTGWIKLQD